jgi:hypothetical protein
MRTAPTTAPITRTSREPNRPRMASSAGAVLVAILLIAAGCGAGSAQPDRANMRANSNNDDNSVNTGASAPPGGQGRTVSSFTVLFAQCMRANGVPNFPDPNGQPGQLGPNSGIDPTSEKFQLAINGPCESLAPPAWVDSGSGSGPGSVAGPTDGGR